MLRILVTLVLLSGAAFGQDVQRTYQFAHVSTPVGYMEVANVFRTIDVPDVSLNEAARTLSTHGTAEQMALADWLFPQVDVSGDAAPAPVPHEYQTTGAAPVVRVFYFANTPSIRAAQEIANVIRTAAGVNRLAVAWQSRALTLRATRDEVAAAAWLWPQLDVAEAAPGAPMQSFHMEGVREAEMRVIHLAHAGQPLTMQELVNSVRVIADMNRVFPLTSSGIVMMRGDAESVALAEWVVRQLDVAENQQGPAPHERQIAQNGEPVAHAFYLTHAATPEAVQQIVNAVRTTTKAQRVFCNWQAKALLLRGTPDQITQAAGIISEMDR